VCIDHSWLDPRPLRFLNFLGSQASKYRSTSESAGTQPESGQVCGHINPLFGRTSCPISLRLLHHDMISYDYDLIGLKSDDKVES
jgi:hypothetical protein